ncbi:MAG: DsrE family protein [Mariprofundaceae bacterium]|nr:DsrE family protein [Mariprofundaceae bacterium]
MNILFILNGAPYGDERSYNGLRLAGALAKRDEVEVRTFLMGDAASASKGGQKVPAGYYNVETMIHQVASCGEDCVSVCGTCMDARGLQVEELAAGIHRGTLNELADWTEWADQVLVF